MIDVYMSSPTICWIISIIVIGIVSVCFCNGSTCKSPYGESADNASSHGATAPTGFRFGGRRRCAQGGSHYESRNFHAHLSEHLEVVRHRFYRSTLHQDYALPRKVTLSATHGRR